MSVTRAYRRPVVTLLAVTAVSAVAAAALAPVSAQASTKAPSRQVRKDLDLRKVKPSSLLHSDKRVSAMVELQAAPAALKYRAALGKGKSAARAASRAAAKASSSQATEVQSHFAKVAPSARTIYRASRVYSGIAVTVKASELPALRTIDGVKSVRVMTPKKVSNVSSVPLMKAPGAWSTGAAGTGQGVSIGIIDTGIDYTHADFGGAGTVNAYNTAKAATTFTPTAKVVGGWDLAGDAYDPDGAQPTPVPDANPLDCDGHGTHVAGTAAGYGVTSAGQTYQNGSPTAADYASADAAWFDQFGLQSGQVGVGPGVAPLADLYAIKVFGCEGGTNLVTEALDRAMDPNGDGDVSDHLDVVNMSLGSDFASPQDPDAQATNTAVLAGVTVVAAMGNAGDLADVGGAPGNATRAIAVAATDDGYGVFDGVSLNVDGSPAGTFPAIESDSYPWSTSAPLTAAVADMSVVDPANSEGCDPVSDAGQKASLNGKIALLHWDESDLGCGSAARAANMVAAGAVGVLYGSVDNAFSAGIVGSATVPAMLTTANAADAIRTALAASHTVNATLTHTLHNTQTIQDGSKVDQIADFSSRGRRAAGGLKPDVSAPGVSIFSAGNGTGTKGLSESGTSMASPHVAGEAALVIGAHPGWSPEEVKAAIMNTAGQDVTDLNGETDGPVRAGAGRVDAEAAVAASSLAYTTTDPGAVSVSFGTVAATAADVTLSKTVRVANKSGADVTYGLQVADASPVPGVTYSTSVPSLMVPAGQDRTFTVRIAVHRDSLRSVPEATLNQDLPRDFTTQAATLVRVTPAGGDALRVPVAATVRPASTISSTVTRSFPVGTTTTGTTSLTGTGVSNGTGTGSVQSRGQGFSLAATSPKLPTCPAAGAPCVPFEDARAGDIKAVGITSNAKPLGDFSNISYVAINTWGPWATPASFAEFDVAIDADRNGRADFVLYNTRYPDSDVMIAELDEILPDGSLSPYDFQPINGGSLGEFGLDFGGPDTAKFDSDTLVMPFLTDLLEGPTSRFDYWVVSGTVETGALDTVGSATNRLTMDAKIPAIQVTQSGDTSGASTYPDLPGRTVAVLKNGLQYTYDKSQGELFVHFHNVDGARAELLAIRQTQTIAQPASLKVNHAQYNGKFAVGAAASSGLPVTVVASPSTVCSYSGGYITPKAAGVCSVTLSQAGNAVYLPVTSPAYKFAVYGSTKVTLTSSDTTVTTSQRVVLTAQVARTTASSVALSGTVRLYDNKKLIATVTMPSTGKVSYSWPTRTRGTHSLTATYSGNTWYTASTSAAVTEKVS